MKPKGTFRAWGDEPVCLYAIRVKSKPIHGDQFVQDGEWYYYRKSSWCNPSKFSPHFSIRNLYRRLGDAQNAIKALKKRIQILDTWGGEPWKVPVEVEDLDIATIEIAEVALEQTGIFKPID